MGPSGNGLIGGGSGRDRMAGEYSHEGIYEALGIGSRCGKVISRRWVKWLHVRLLVGSCWGSQKILGGGLSGFTQLRSCRSLILA